MMSKYAKRLEKLEAARDLGKRKIRLVVDKNTGITRPGPDGVMCHIVTINVLEEWAA